MGREIEKKVMRKGGIVGSFFMGERKGGRVFGRALMGGVFLLCVTEKECESEVLIFLVREAQMERGWLETQSWTQQSCWAQGVRDEREREQGMSEGMVSLASRERRAKRSKLTNEISRKGPSAQSPIALISKMPCSPLCLQYTLA